MTEEESLVGEEIKLSMLSNVLLIKQSFNCTDHQITHNIMVLMIFLHDICHAGFL